MVAARKSSSSGMLAKTCIEPTGRFAFPSYDGDLAS
jgi:hypothetical protein